MKKNEVLNCMREMIGEYAGGGKNHEGETFTSTFRLDAVEGPNGVSFLYTAKVGNQTVHDEHSIMSGDEAGRLSVFALTSNTPAVLQHLFQESLSRNEGDRATFVFQYGEVENMNSFRERLMLVLSPKEQAIEYIYSWGMPGKDFGERSRSRMKRIA